MRLIAIIFLILIIVSCANPLWDGDVENKAAGEDTVDLTISIDIPDAWIKNGWF